MGLYDTINCEYPLPGDPPGFVQRGEHEFQTKDTPDCYMTKYTITREGRLLDCHGVDQEYHGDLEFYCSNGSGCDKRGWYTRHGEDREWVTYVARFTNGKLEALTETEREREPALPVREMFRHAD